MFEVLKGKNGSHPSRGAWIEICETNRNRRTQASHPSRGAWIEIASSITAGRWLWRRTPHGVRGLKYRQARRYRREDEVAPLTGCVD